MTRERFSLGTLHFWMSEALALAETALPQDVPVAALVLDEQGQLIGRGINTRERDQNPTGHAELNALQAAAKVRDNWRMEGCTLVVTLEPCPMCASALAQVRISHIVYAAPDALQGACGSCAGVQVHWPVPPQITGGILEVEAVSRLKSFFQQRRKAL
jgi:tRNA(adenine34) deaminase